MRRQREAAMDAAEADVLKAIIEALTKWLERVAEKVLAAFRRFGSPPDPSGVWTTSSSWEHEVDRLIHGSLSDAAERGWELASDRSFVTSNSFVQAQLAVTRNLLVRIPDDTYNLIFAEISDGMNKGEDNRQIAARVDKLLSMTRSERWKNRAITIARTETMRAYNAGAYGSGLQAEQIEGVPMTKEWLATEDARTRPTHREADGQEQPLSQPFIVGGFPLQFPGDPMAPPEEVINCRCNMLMKERDDGR